MGNESSDRTFRNSKHSKLHRLSFSKTSSSAFRKGVLLGVAMEKGFLERHKRKRVRERGREEKEKGERRRRLLDANRADGRVVLQFRIVVKFFMIPMSSPLFSFPRALRANLSQAKTSSGDAEMFLPLLLCLGIVGFDVFLASTIDARTLINMYLVRSLFNPYACLRACLPCLLQASACSPLSVSGSCMSGV